MSDAEGVKQTNSGSSRHTSAADLYAIDNAVNKPDEATEAFVQDTVTESMTIEDDKTAGCATTGTCNDKRGDAPPDLDLVQFCARSASNNAVIKWKVPKRTK